MNKQKFKNTIYQEIANVGKALSNPYRLRILNLISQDDYSHSWLPLCFFRVYQLYPGLFVNGTYGPRQATYTCVRNIN